MRSQCLVDAAGWWPSLHDHGWPWPGIRRSSCRCCSGAPEEPGESKCERQSGTTATISSEFVCKPHWLAFLGLLTLLPLFTHWWLLPSIHTTLACLPPWDKPSVILFPHLLPQHHAISLKMLPGQQKFWNTSLLTAPSSKTTICLNSYDHWKTQVEVLSTAPYPTPVAGKSTCLKGKPKNTLPDFLLLLCRGTNPGATCMASKKQHKQMHSSVYLTKNLREAIPLKDADFAIRLEQIFTPITYITDMISLQEMRNVTEDDGPPKFLCPFCNWCQKPLFCLGQGRIGCKIKASSSRKVIQYHCMKYELWLLV